jgi:hypothetical protein
MQALQSWSFARLLLVAAGWVFLCVLVGAAWLLFPLVVFSVGSSGSGGGIGAVGVGAVSAGISELMLAIPVIPPIILIVVWLATRWR